MKAKTKTGIVDMTAPENTAGKQKDVGGSKSDRWNLMLVNEVANTLWLKYDDDDWANMKKAGAIGAMLGIAPRDELEGMLAAQLLASHFAAMECYRRALLAEQTFEGRRENLSQANKLSRTYTSLLEALNRHRGKGQQKVTVEHVTVNAGGQAIVGNVEQPGGGAPPKSKEQPHALAHAPSTTMPST